MRQVSAEFLLFKDIDELKAGHHLLLLKNGRPLAEIVPVPEIDATLAAAEQERKAAREKLLALMDEGIDLGGLRIEDRDELYRRERGPK